MSDHKYHTTTDDGIRLRSGKASICIRVPVDTYRVLKKQADSLRGPFMPAPTVSAVASRILDSTVRDLVRAGRTLTDFAEEQGSEPTQDCSSNPRSCEEGEDNDEN